MNKVRSFQDLRVWKNAHQLALLIYKKTQDFPREERYGLTSQIRRASVSIAANIAEGSKRSTTNDFCHFLSISEGSNEEVKCLLFLARDLQFMDLQTFHNAFSQTEAIGSMLFGLIKSLKTPY